ncbi:peptidase S8/S53 domain-containing protein [Podospora fimiseda]|uniref:tripeptidyl-peptidase II n=1 Tax=Podospora fimiseda TaxID=252190 RepID=A0AAN7BHQ3_9PEZI|nr:peptidase S8/S53 domain-containing protein [Podospora fimiseda]
MLLLSSLLLATAASARVMDALAAIPHGWKQVRSAEPEEEVLLRVGLKQQHAQALEQAVLDISTPGHVNYGKHMTREELKSYTAPSDAATSAVVEWLQNHGIQPAVDNDWVTFTTTVSKANRLLDTRFAWFKNSDDEDKSPKIRALSYAVPDQVARHIDLVQPTTRFGQPNPQRSTIFDMYRPERVHGIKLAVADNQSVNCGRYITPSCLRDLYNVKYTPTNDTGNKVAFASFLEQYARYDDLQKFQAQYLPAALGQNFTVELVNGGLDDQKSWQDSGEANLDVQYLLSMSYPIPILQYSTAGRGPLIPTRGQSTPPGSNEPYFEWLQYLLGLPDVQLPQTISVSYGEEEQSVPREYALRVCNMFMQLGARGVSVLFASGDSGPGNYCESNTNNSTYFESMFPAGCPWVTAVGATLGTQPEQGTSFSSGGFSMYHDRPAWQSAAVESYLAQIGNTYAPYFDRGGRGFPDVAAQGNTFYVIDKGYLALLSGTSASAPVVAGIIALLNAARRSQGQKPLGFLNPWLYANPNAWTDITQGAGTGCRYRPEFIRTAASWNATVGWDPVTGLGTPKFPELLALAAPGVPNA